MSDDRPAIRPEATVPGSPLREIFVQALTRKSAEDRELYLAEACGKDPESRALVTSLLEAHEQAGDFLEHPVMGDPSELPSEGLGTLIGRYKLLEKIGEGGFGTVYLAEQTEPVRRRVAVKVIKLGMDTRQVIARFEAERQALAMMEHPNIAKVLDAAATDTGRPYFVMELVRGVKLTEYCERNRLGLGERLVLFIQVCNAIQHAHEKGVIHRDLKPSNILVTLPDGPASAGVPKVIDFGIAKAVAQKLTEKTIFTEFQTLVGTPAYISPEQAEMSSMEIDTRTDIYSLGVLLYELLTGATPFSGEELLRSGLDGMRKTIREVEPLRPSTRLAHQITLGGSPARGGWVRGAECRAANAPPPEDGTPSEGKRSSQATKELIKQLRGDLDCIVLKCLEKDKALRYDTAHALAMDLRRFLRHEPILARPPSTGYRMRQTFRRHKFGIAAAGAVTAALVIGLVATTLQGLRARNAWFRERRNAYSAEVNVAFQALAENDLGRARELLERQRPHPGEEDLRGFEWRYLWTLCRGDEVESFTDPAANAVAFSPDGRIFAYGSSEVTVRETASGRVVARLQDSASGDPRNKFFGGELGVRTLSFSPDGRMLACAQDSGTMLWDTLTWQKVRILAGAAIPTEFSPDGRWLMTGTTNGLQLWNTKTWESLGEFAAPAASQFVNRYNSAFSPDSRALVTVGEAAGLRARKLVLWQVPEMRILAELNLPGAPVGSVRFSADGKYLFAGKWDGELAVLDITSNKPVATRTEHAGWIRGVAIAGDGKSVVTASSDRTLNIWDAAPLSLRTRLRGHVGEVRSVALAPGGAHILSASTDGTTKLWRTETRRDESRLSGAGIVAGFLPDGTVVGASRDRIVQWNPRTAAQHATLIGKDALAAAAGSSSIALAMRLEKAFVAISKEDGTIDLWDLSESTRVRQWEAHGTPTTAVAFTPGGGLLASGSSTGEVKIWNPATKQLVLQLGGLEGAIRGLNFSKDGQRLAACGDSSRIFAWHVATGDRCFVSGQHGGPETVIDSVSFSPDGELLAATTLQSNETHLWELRSGRRRHVLKGHIQGVKASAFSPDNRTLATASGDRKVKLWNVATGQQLAAFALPERCISIAFSPDGNSLAVGCSPNAAGAEFIRVWRAPAILEIEEIK